MLLLSAAQIEAALPMPRAVEVMREAFVVISEQRAQVAQRQALPLESGTGLLMGAAVENIGIAAKVVSVMPGNAARSLPGTVGSLLLMDPETGRPMAFMDGTALTAWRTAAISACAIDQLARPESHKALLIGCGTQASTQVLGMDAVRDLGEIAVHASDQQQVADFIDTHQARVKARLLPADPLPEFVVGSDIIVTATNSHRPVFDANDVRPGCHINGIGSFRHDMCEIDPALVGRAKVFVESPTTAADEAGELVAAVQAGQSRVEDWTELGEVIAGRAGGRDNEQQLTLFKSVGHAVFDLYAARAVFDAARAQGLGHAWTG